MLNSGSKSTGTAILRNQEDRGATSAKGVPQDVPTAEIGQRTKISGLDSRQQDRQPLSWRAQNKWLKIVRYRARLFDIIIGYVARRSGTQFADQIGWQAVELDPSSASVAHQALKRGLNSGSKKTHEQSTDSVKRSTVSVCQKSTLAFVSKNFCSLACRDPPTKLGLKCKFLNESSRKANLISFVSNISHTKK